MTPGARGLAAQPRGNGLPSETHFYPAASSIASNWLCPNFLAYSLQSRPSAEHSTGEAPCCKSAAHIDSRLCLVAAIKNVIPELGCTNEATLHRNDMPGRPVGKSLCESGCLGAELSLSRSHVATPEKSACRNALSISASRSASGILDSTWHVHSKPLYLLLYKVLSACSCPANAWDWEVLPLDNFFLVGCPRAHRASR